MRVSPLLFLCCLLAGLLTPACKSRESRPLDEPVIRAGGTVLTREEVETLAARSGQRVYVPVYAHVYHWRNEPYALTSTLSIRNTDEHASLIVTAVTYYDTQGQLLHEYASRPLRIGPLSTLEYIVGANESEGGSGANFIVAWFSECTVSEPIIECVMVGTHNQQGISLISRGTPLRPEP